MEFPREARFLRAGLIGAIAVIAAAAVVVLGRGGSDYVPGHAYEIPAGDRRVLVEVLNGSGRQGLARTATRLLRRQGIDVVLFGNADGPAESTMVVVRRGSGDAARRVIETLGVGRVRQEPDTLRRVDLSVILGRDFRPPAELHP